TDEPTGRKLNVRMQISVELVTLQAHHEIFDVHFGGARLSLRCSSLPRIAFKNAAQLAASKRFSEDTGNAEALLLGNPLRRPENIGMTTAHQHDRRFHSL